MEHLKPGLHGPSLRWHKPSGIAYWMGRSTIRYWLTGRPVFGRGDNATLLHDATVDYRGGPRERLTRARWRRLARRWALAGAPALLYACDWRAFAAYAGLGAAGAGWWGWRTWRVWWPEREVRREFTRPTATVLSRVLGERTSHRAISLQLDPLEARVHLPLVPLDDGMRKRVVSACAERLGIADPSAAWTVRGSRAHVDIAPRRLPPVTLSYREVRELVADASETRPFVGLAAGREPVYADLDNDGPHLAVSASTGAGKSTLMRLILARRVQAGVGLIVCDYKVISHRWARRIAQDDPHRALYVTDEPEISDAVLSAFAEFHRRREILKTRPEDLSTFRPVDLVVEELNTLAAMLRKWWGHERRRLIQEAKDMDMDPGYLPTVPEAVDALGVLVQAGRELRIHVHVIAQRLDASILAPRDGGAVRESFANRFLAGYTQKAWNMLVDSGSFQAFPGGPRGIWASVQGGSVQFFRCPFISDDEAYALAMSGEAPAGPVLGGARLIPERDVKRLQRLVTLAEAVDLLPSRPSLPGLQKAVQRAGMAHAGKRGNAFLFDLAELERVLES